MREIRIDGRTLHTLSELRSAVVRAVGAHGTVGHTVEAITELLEIEPLSLTWDHSADSERAMGAAVFGRVDAAWRDLEARRATFRLALR